MSKINLTAPESFCPQCGSLLRTHKKSTSNTCIQCSYRTNSRGSCQRQGLGLTLLNAPEAFAKNMVDGQKKLNTKGTIVEQKCPQCDNNEMSYDVIQLRSADEGQTVFYTCTKCNYKIYENS